MTAPVLSTAPVARVALPATAPPPRPASAVLSTRRTGKPRRPGLLPEVARPLEIHSRDDETKKSRGSQSRRRPPPLLLPPSAPKQPPLAKRPPAQRPPRPRSDGTLQLWAPAGLLAAAAASRGRSAAHVAGLKWLPRQRLHQLLAPKGRRRRRPRRQQTVAAHGPGLLARLRRPCKPCSLLIMARRAQGKPKPNRISPAALRIRWCDAECLCSAFVSSMSISRKRCVPPTPRRGQTQPVGCLSASAAAAAALD